MFGLNWMMLCFAIVSSVILIHRERVSALSLTSTEIQYSPKTLNVVNTGSSDYTEMPRRNRRKFSNQGITKGRIGVKRRHQNRGRTWNKRCDVRRGRKGWRSKNIERNPKKAEVRCAKILEDWEKSNRTYIRRAGRDIQKRLKKIKIFSEYATCMEEAVSEVARCPF